jgi:hypothetical protein
MDLSLTEERVGFEPKIRDKSYTPLAEGAFSHSTVSLKNDYYTGFIFDEHLSDTLKLDAHLNG